MRACVWVEHVDIGKERTRVGKHVDVGNECTHVGKHMDIENERTRVGTPRHLWIV